MRPLTPQARGGQSPIQELAVSLPGPAVDWEAPLFPPFPLRCINCVCSSALTILHDRGFGRPLVDCIEPLDLTGHVVFLEPSAKARRVETMDLDVPNEDDSDHESAVVSAVPQEFDSYCLVANSLSGIAHMAGVAAGPSSKTAQLPLDFSSYRLDVLETWGIDDFVTADFYMFSCSQLQHFSFSPLSHFEASSLDFSGSLRGPCPGNLFEQKKNLRFLKNHQKVKFGT